MVYYIQYRIPTAFWRIRGKGEISVADKHLLEQMETILARISAPIHVVSREQLLRDGMPSEFDALLAGGQLRAYEGRLYQAIPDAQLALVCQDDYPGAKDLMQLACEMIAAIIASSTPYTENSFDVYRRALRGELAGSELDALSHEYQLPDDLKRSVLVFHIVQTDSERAYDLLRDITPMQDKDVLIDMDRHTVVLIKDTSDDESIDELIQFAEALQETLMSETAHQMTIGVGRSRHTMDALRESYSEARKAIEVGRVFKPDKSIFVYDRLVLERFLMELPADSSAYYHSLLFNRKNQRLFNEEMLYTIDMFFRKDLNLSDTARQLYIHRNTLVYRLDKVQKQTGLDLRSFEDAVTFKILMELKKVAGDRNNTRKS